MKATVAHHELQSEHDAAERNVKARLVPVGADDDFAEISADRMATQAQRLAADYRGSDSTIRRSTGAAATHAPATGVDATVLRGASAGGSALADGDRGRLEAAYDTELGNVRVHTDGAADQIARSIGAAAFTSGSDIFFAKGEYSPQSQRGSHILAHEVAHTTQNSSGGKDPLRRFPSSALTSPVPWQKMTGSVMRPSEGVSGGVFILTSKLDPAEIKHIVAKPIYEGLNGLKVMETPEASVFGDSALRRLFGINTPQSRIARKGSSEYADLLALCKPKAPAKDPNDPNGKELSDAGSFLVMGAVSGKSFAGLATSSATDTNSFDLLQRTLFNPAILQQFGRLGVADMLLGNQDRITAGGMNLGNVMVSSTNGKLDLWAIDTLASLPKYEPKNIANGNFGGGGFVSAKADLDSGPKEIVDKLFSTLAGRIEAGIQDPAIASSPAAPHTVLTQRYAAEGAAVLAHFQRGWDMALAEIGAMAAKLKSMDRTKGTKPDEENLQARTLMANMQYLGARAKGGSDADGTAAALPDVLENYAASLDFDRLTASDALMPTGLAMPAKAVLAADIPATSLSVAALNALEPNANGVLSAGAQSALPAYITKVGTAHGEVDAAVDQHKVRKKGLMLRNTVLPRNRNLVGHFYVNAQASTAGAFGIVGATRTLQGIKDQLTTASQARFDKGKGRAVADAMRRADGVANSLASSVAVVRQQSTVVQAAIPKMSFAEKTAFIATHGKVAAQMTNADKYIAGVKKANLGGLAAKIGV